MKTEMVLRRLGGSLHPYGDASWKSMDRIANGSTIVVTMRKSRNPEHLMKYWAILDDAIEFDPEYDHRDDLDAWIRLSIPWMRDQIVLGDGRVVVKLKSIAIDEMDQTEFDKFYEQAIELLRMRIDRDPESLRVKLPRHGSFDR